MKLPTEEKNIVKADIYCDGNQIVRYETFKNMSAVSVTKFENNRLTIKGNRISTKCDSSENCDDVDEHSFDGLIQEDIVCRL